METATLIIYNIFKYFLNQIILRTKREFSQDTDIERAAFDLGETKNAKGNEIKESLQ